LDSRWPSSLDQHYDKSGLDEHYDKSESIK
jgi:hypothetical protein